MIGRDWTQKELDFYRGQAAKGLTKTQAAEAAKKAGFPDRRSRAIKDKLSVLGQSWTAWGGTDNQTRLTSLDVVPDLDEAVLRDRKEKAQQVEMELLRKKYNKLLIEKTLEAEILKTIKENVTALPVYDKVPPLVKPTPAGIIEEAIVLNMCDAHTGEVVSPKETMGFNEYNYQIFQHRIETLVDTTLRFLDILTTYRYKKLFVLLMGDCISGRIHEELLQHADLTIADSIFGCASVFEKAIMELSQRFPEVECVCNVGNHGRWGKEYYFKGKSRENFDFIIYKILQERFRTNPQVKFNIAEGPLTVVDIESHPFLVGHGDGIRGQWGIPFYGIQREVAKWADFFSIKEDTFEYVCLAHFHIPYELPRTGGGMIYGSGAIVGANEYSISRTKIIAPASQTLRAVHRKRGVTLKAEIDLQNLPEKEEWRYNLKAA